MIVQSKDQLLTGQPGAQMSSPTSQQGEDDELISYNNLMTSSFERPREQKKVSGMALGRLGQLDTKN